LCASVDSQHYGGGGGKNPTLSLVVIVGYIKKNFAEQIIVKIIFFTIM
jgi:hypothetical protein